MPIIDKEGNFLAVADNVETISNSAAIADVMAQFANAEILGIIFPTHHDGRGYSLTKKLRRAGFNGKLRAIGPLIPDQFSDLIACGFDEIEISDEQFLRQPLVQWLAAKEISQHSYQNNNSTKTSIFQSRRQKIAANRHLNLVRELP
ncbi:MAG: hypothetical protein FD163_2191 [Hyphomonadaceae bacterium]|nr:MAG: hypothetical protein FD163_2191 [Hyphomonadaceae bacterium]